jgi:hypothetical protein
MDFRRLPHRRIAASGKNNTDSHGLSAQITRNADGPNPTPETRKLNTPGILPPFRGSPQAVNATREDDVKTRAVCVAEALASRRPQSTFSGSAGCRFLVPA